MSEQKIIFLRHGHSPSQISDFDRVLSPRGRNQITAVSRHLQQINFTPDIILVSPYKRTLETLDIVLSNFKDTKAVISDCIGSQTKEEFLKVLFQHLEHYSKILVIGHIPMMAEVPQELAFSQVNLSTGCYAMIKYENNSDKANKSFALCEIYSPDGDIL